MSPSKKIQAPEPKTSGAPVELTDANITAVLALPSPAIIDFYATWCGPCKKLAPDIERLAAEYAGRVNVCKADVEKCPMTVAMYGIMSVPTVVMFKNGSPAGSMDAVPYDRLAEACEKLLGYRSAP